MPEALIFDVDIGENFIFEITPGENITLELVGEVGPRGAQGPQGIPFKPYRLNIFYGVPGLANGIASDDYAAGLFAGWDLIVFGAGLEDVLSPFHDSTVNVIDGIHALRPDAKLFGYIDVGVTTGNFGDAKLRDLAQQWQDTGADGVFLDCAGYDFDVSRARLNAIVDHAHRLGLATIVNAWNPDDVMGEQVDAVHNPSGDRSLMGSRDFYLLESFLLNSTAYATTDGYADLAFVKAKVDRCRSHRDALGVKLLGISQWEHSSETKEQLNNRFRMNEATAITFGLDGYGFAPINFGAAPPDAQTVTQFEFNDLPKSLGSHSVYHDVDATEILRSDAGLRVHVDVATGTYWFRQDSVGYTQKTIERGQPDGYAALDGTAKVPTWQLGTGVPDGTKFLRDDSSWSSPGLTTSTFTHVQLVPATEWTVSHNLGFRPSVQVEDSAGTVVIGDVTYVDDNTVVLTFSVAFGGSAHFS